MQIANDMNLTLKIWRQKNAKAKGQLVEYKIKGISPDSSFFEMLDNLNQELIEKGEEPVAFDKIIQAGGYVSVNTGGVPDANALPIPKVDAERSMDAAACIGCGACVAACKNASAMLFVSAKVAQFAYLPQGKVEAKERVLKMVAKMDELGFGNCSNTYACEAECPKGISVENIAKMNREFLKAKIS